MNEKLSDNELIEELDSAFACKLADAWEYPSRKPVIEQAYEQIKSLIESQAQPSEEWIKEKARELYEISSYADRIHGFMYAISINSAEDFIRNLSRGTRG